MKDIKKLLSENRSDVLPDDGLKERIRHELGYDDASPALAYAHGGQTAGSRKKFIIAEATPERILPDCPATSSRR